MILVLGSGESGVGSALLAKSKGLSVFVSDSSLIKKVYREILIKNQINWEDKGHYRVYNYSCRYSSEKPWNPRCGAQ